MSKSVLVFKSNTGALHLRHVGLLKINIIDVSTPENVF